MSELGQIIGDDKSRLEVDDEAQIGMFGNLSYFEIPSETTYVDPVSIKVDKLYPDLGSTFILSHDTASILGTDRLGYVLSSTTRAFESKIYEDFSESFSATTYKDTTNTTAAGWGTGSIRFSTGSVVQSLNIGSDISLDTTNIDRVKMSVIGTKTYLTVGSMTTDGTNWFGLDYDIWRQFPTGSTGSVIQWKIIATGSASTTYADALTNTTYVDTSETTATVDTTAHTVDFSGGFGIYVFKTENYMVSGTITKVTPNLAITGLGSYQLQLKNLTGSPWTNVTNNIEHTFSNSGSELFLRVVSLGNLITAPISLYVGENIELDNVDIIYKQDDV